MTKKAIAASQRHAQESQQQGQKQGQKKTGRNLHACATIMRKGGVHEKSGKAKRAGSKQQLKKAKREGGNSSPFYCLLFSDFRLAC